MADPGRDDLVLGEEAVRRGLLSPEHLAEARETQRLAVDAGLPISLSEVLLQRKYLNEVQIETLQQRLRESPAGQAAPRTGDSTRSLPPRPASYGSSAGPNLPSSARAIGPFPPIPSAPESAAPEASLKRGSGRTTSLPPGTAKRGSGRASALSPGTSKRGSGRSSGVSAGTAKRGSSPAAQAVPLAQPAPAVPGKRGSGRLAAVPPVTGDRPGSIAAGAISPEPLAGSTERNPPGKKTEAPVAVQSPSTRMPARIPQRKSSSSRWILLVLLLLVGSNTATWFLARQTTHTMPAPAASFGPSFDPLMYWVVIGPFPAKTGADLDTVHPPEQPERDLKATLKGAKGPLKWKLARMQRNQISLDTELGEQHTCNAYGLTYVECPAETQAILGIGSDDSVRVWLNGEQVHENREQRGCSVDQDRVTVNLKAGLNEILIKIGQGTGTWGFAATLRAPDGKPLPGLQGRLPKEIVLPQVDKPAPSPTKPASKPDVPKKKS